MTSSPDPIGPLQDLLGYHFRRTSNLFRKDFDRATEGLDIRQVNFGVLSVISANPGIRQGEVGTILDIQRANMVAIVSELNDAGLVDRGRDPMDKRAVTLTLSVKGQKLLTDAIERIAEHEKRLLRGLSAQDRTQLLDLLRRIERNGQDD